MAGKSSWRDLLLCFCIVKENSASIDVKNCRSLTREPLKGASKNGSFQRISFSDISNPESPIEDLSISLGSNLHVFTLAELQSITQNFKSSYLLGEGGFGPVHKGFVDEKLRPGLKWQAVAVKNLDQEGLQGHREWLTEVIFLGQLRHPHLVKLLGFCCEDEHRLLVYEFMSKGSLENHLFKRFSTPLPWPTRMKIAIGAAKGLAFLHDAEKPVIYRDFKASNILLDSDYTAKLSDFGLAKDGPEGDATHVSTRVMGTPGYAAPEYVMTGHLTAKSDVYSFGVVLLELLTGRRSMDKKRPSKEQNLVEWARNSLNDTRKLARIIDPNLDGQYSVTGVEKAAALAFRCLSHRPKHRPAMNTIVEILEPLQDLDDIPINHFVYTVSPVKDEGGTRMVPKEKGAAHVFPRGHRHRRLSARSPAVLVSYSDTALCKNAGNGLYRNYLKHRGRGE